MAECKVCLVVGLMTTIVIFVYVCKETPHFSKYISHFISETARNNKTSHSFGQSDNPSNNNSNNRSLMLSIQRNGRLGNAMWEYSALRGLANITNRIPILNSQFRDLTRIFELPVPIENKATRFKRFHRYNVPNRNVKYDVIGTINKLKNIADDVMLNGFFQYFRFFYHISDRIREEFTFRKDIQHKVIAFFDRQNLTENNLVKVGIHIRRGDLVTDSSIKAGFGPPPVSYFTNAMKYFRSKYKNVHFFVCSNDLRWARKHILGGDVTFVEHQAAAVDMATMASCDHVIVSNGTFSWWIGWLCKGITVRYKRMPKRNTIVYNMTGGEYWPPDDAFNHYVVIDS